jgi:hypothetical protein
MDASIIRNTISLSARLVREPRRVISEQHKKASFKAAIKYCLLYSAAMIAVFSFFMLGGMLLLRAPAITVVTLGAMMAVFAIFIPMSLIIQLLVVTAVLMLMIVLLKGKCDFEEMFYLLVVTYLPSGIITTAALMALMALVGIPVVLSGIDVGELMLPLMAHTSAFMGLTIIFNLLFMAYPLYLTTLVIKEASGLTTARSVLAWAIPLGLYMVPFLLMFGIMTLTMPSINVMSVEGMQGMSPVFPSTVMANGPQNATISLMFKGNADNIRITSDALGISLPDGRACRIDGLYYETDGDGIDHQVQYRALIGDAGENSLPEYRFTLNGDLIGPGCGGTPGQAFAYDVRMTYSRGATELEASQAAPETVNGRISGKLSRP